MNCINRKLIVSYFNTHTYKKDTQNMNIVNMTIASR